MKNAITGAALGLTIAGLITVSDFQGAFAAEVGRTTIDGKEVILFDDNTWAFAQDSQAAAAAEDSDCTILRSERIPAQICLDPEKWVMLIPTPPAEFMLQHPSEEVYLVIVAEKTYVPMRLLKKAILQNAQVATGLSKVRVLGDSTSVVDGRDFGHVTFSSNAGGLHLIHENFHFTDKLVGSVQFGFFTGASIHPNIGHIIDDAVSSIKVGN